MAEKEKGRFWGSDSESSSDDDSSSSDEESDREQHVVVNAAATNRWAADVEESDSSDDEGRVVRTLKVKRFAEVNKQIDTVHKVLKIRDWNELVVQFQKLNQLLEKRAAVIIQQYGLPTSFFRLLVTIEDAIKAMTKPDIKALSKTASRSFQRQRQNFKKLVAEMGYAERMKAYRENPTAGSDDEDDAAGAGKDAKADGGKEKKAKKKKKSSDSSSSDSDSDSSSSDSDSDSDSDSSSSDSDSDSSGSSSSSGGGGKGSGSDSEVWDSDSDSSSSDDDDAAGGVVKFTREFWLKKPQDIEKEKEKVRKMMVQLEGAIASKATSMVMTRVLKAAKKFEYDIADLPFPPFLERLVPDDRDTIIRELKNLTFIDANRASVYIADRTAKNLPEAIKTRFIQLVEASKEAKIEEDEDSEPEEGAETKPVYVELPTDEKVHQLLRWFGKTLLFKDATKILVQLQAEAAREASKKDTQGAVKEKIKTYRFNTPAEFLAQVAKVQAKRGRKGFSFENYCTSLRALVSAASNFGLKYQIPAMLRLVSVCFDLGRDRNTAIPADIWRSSVQLLLQVLRMLGEHPEVVLKRITTDTLMDEDDEEQEAGAVESKDGGGGGAKAPAGADAGPEVIHTHANFVSLASQFQQDLTKALKLLNNRADEYLERVADETILDQLFVAVQAFFEREAAATPAPDPSADLTEEGALKAFEKAMQAHNDVRQNLATIAYLRVEHIYYLHDTAAQPLRALAALQARANYDALNNVHPGARGTAARGTAAAARGNDPALVNPAAMATTFDEHDPTTSGGEPLDSVAQMRRLCKTVYDHNGPSAPRMRVRTVLHQIYHLALHDKYAEAKSLLLMSRFQDQADDWDIETQVVFNRAMAQLGLAALRRDSLTDALRCLADLCSGSKINELLAQRVSRFWNDKNTTKEEQNERELKERQRLLPFHRHLNTDLLEACHNTAAMLIEIPNLVAEANHMDLRGSYEPASKIFRRSLNNYELQVFEGPPENNRERVMLAAQHLSRGDWRTCSGLVFGLPCWKLWGHYDVASIHAVLLKRMKEVALRTYLLKFHTHYASLGVQALCGMFELPVDAVQGVVNRMIISKEFIGSWQDVLDGTPEERQAVHIYHVEPTPLQRLALSFADKATQFGRHNMNLLNGTTDGNFEVRKGDRRYDNRGRGGWGGRGGRGGGRGGRGRGRGGNRRGGRDLVQAPGRMQIRWR